MLIMFQTLQTDDVHRSFVMTPQCRGGHITCSFLRKSGLGNQLFQYASLVGVANIKLMTVLLPSDLQLHQYFRLPRAPDNDRMTSESLNWKDYSELKANSF